MKKYLLFFVVLVVSFTINAQVKVNENGSIWQGYNGYPNIYMGTYTKYEPSNGQYYTNAPWALEVWGENFNIWKPWPTPYNGLNRNYYLFINVSGGVGIGKVPTNSGICLDVRGVVFTTGVSITSDERLKTNIKALSSKVAGMYKLSGKSYKKHPIDAQLSLPNIVDDNKNTIKKFEKSNLKQSKGKDEFGFLAQELKEIYPELVSQDSLGYYSINYIGLIPVLVEAIKEQKSTIDELSATVKNLYPNQPQNIVAEKNTVQNSHNIPTIPLLEQNIPNPFNTETQINYFIPDNFSAANIYIYDMNGTQLKKYQIFHNGKGTVNIRGAEFNAGMYLYSLIVDGKVIDTKRMILTK